MTQVIVVYYTSIVYAQLTICLYLLYNRCYHQILLNEKKMKRNLSNQNISKLKKTVRKHNLNEVCSAESAQLAFTIFLKIYKTILSRMLSY